jgi:hypothetical protein
MIESLVRWPRTVSCQSYNRKCHVCETPFLVVPSESNLRVYVCIHADGYVNWGQKHCASEHVSTQLHGYMNGGYALRLFSCAHVKHQNDPRHHVYTYMIKYVCVYVCMYVHLCVYMYVCMYVCIVYAYIHNHECMHTCSKAQLPRELCLLVHLCDPDACWRAL